MEVYRPLKHTNRYYNRQDNLWWEHQNKNFQREKYISNLISLRKEKVEVEFQPVMIYKCMILTPEMN